MAGELELVHGENCGGAPGMLCVRCMGFQPGHDIPTRHGAYVAPFKLAERAGEIAELLDRVAPVRSSADSALFGLCSIALTRIERAAAALEKADADGESIPALETNLRQWIRQAASLLEQAGMSPQARAALGLTLTELEQARRRSLDLSRLSDVERDELERLVGKAGDGVFDGVDLPDADAFRADRVRRGLVAERARSSWVAWATLAELELLYEHLVESIRDDPPGWAPDVVARLELLQFRAGRRRAGGVRPWRLSRCALHGAHLDCCHHQRWLIQYERARDLCVDGVAGCRCVELVLDDGLVDPLGLRAAAGERCLGRRVPRLDRVAVDEPVDRVAVERSSTGSTADAVVVVDVPEPEPGPVSRARRGELVGGRLLIPGVDADPVALIASLSRSAWVGYRGE